MRTRTFELEADEKYLDRSRLVHCDSKGDSDDLKFGCLFLDDRDRFEGFGVSAERESNSDWTVLVDDYDHFKDLRRQEESIATAEENIRVGQQEIDVLEAEIASLRGEAREMLAQFCSH